MKKNILATILLIILVGCNSNKSAITKSALEDSLFKASNKRYDKVEQLLKKMTLEEKIGQMNQYNGFYDVTGPAPQGGDAATKYENLKKGFVGSMLNIKGVDNVRKLQKLAVEESRLGIPLLFGYDIIHGYKTLSPIPLAEAASWDMAAIERSARVAAREAAASGINWTFAPMVDICRDPRWGRVMEGSGEDPYLGSMIAKARVRGFQGEDLSDPFTIAACLKHFAGYGFAEGGRDYNTTEIGRVTLHNVVLPPFVSALQAGAATVMNSFNELNGVPATADQYLLRELLKGKYNFDGMVVSDWGSIGELIPHGYAANGEEAAMLAANAGCDMDMESLLYLKHLKRLVAQGKVDAKVIDDAARRILNLKYELGLFDDPYKYCENEREAKTVLAVEHKKDVLEMAKKSIVLLKNDTNLLPLPKDKKIAVIGPMVSEKNSPLGSWRIASDDNTAVSMEEGLKALQGYYFTFYNGVKLQDAPTSFLKEVQINTTDRTGIEDAVTAAKNADIVILALGEDGYQSGEGRSRTKLDWPGLQLELAQRIKAVNDNVVLVNFSGRPLDLSWADANIPTILQVWQLGTESGNAIAAILTGQYNPSGRLPMSFPRSVGQIPVYYNKKSTGRPDKADFDMVFWSHYMDEDHAPLYPFGFGLGYHDARYSNLNVTRVGDDLQVSVNVTNKGKITGIETVQCYIHDVACKIIRPDKELKSFKQVSLKPNESQVVTFTLTKSDLSYLDGDGNIFFQGGEFDIMVGPSSGDLQTERIIFE